MFWKTIRGSTRVYLCLRGDWWPSGSCLVARACEEPEREALGSKSAFAHGRRELATVTGPAPVGTPDVRGPLTSTQSPDTSLELSLKIK